ncbi:MAG: glycosyltransferase family 39 protein [Planctomycetota bacterium]|nr:glycosyltransferase family 39 protein [Planctomycetota bacterium]
MNSLEQSNKKSLKPLILVAVITIVTLLPFINKAVHIDSPIYLRVAEHIHQQPLDFYGFEYNYFGYSQSVAEINKNPPLISYYYALWAAIFGWSEWGLHLSAFLLIALSTVGVYKLAESLKADPKLAFALTFFTPYYLVASTNLMAEPGVVATWVWSIYLWVNGISKSRNKDLIGAGILIGCAGLTKYIGLALIPLLLVYSIAKAKKVRLHLLFLFIPLAMWGAFELWTSHLYGQGLIFEACYYSVTTKMGTAQHSGSLRFLKSTFVGLSYVGGGLLPISLFILVCLRERLLLWGLAPIFLLSLGLCYYPPTRTILFSSRIVSFDSTLFFALYCSAGSTIFLFLLSRFWKNYDSEVLLLTLWIFGIFTFGSYVNWTQNARSFLLMAPPTALLVARYKSLSVSKPIDFKSLFALILGAFISLSVAWGDYEWADSIRRSAKSITKRYTRANRTIWLQGHWDFQWYMTKNGAKALDRTSPVVRGNDIIVVPHNNTITFALQASNLKWMGELKSPNSSFIIVNDSTEEVGYYSSMGGNLPYKIKNDSYDVYSMYRLK